MLRVLLADDNPQPHFKVVGSVPDGHTLTEAAAELRPGIIVTDLAMPVLNGPEAAKELKNSKNA
jgi:DNA-binding NarL/FixJ family response regulator